MSTPSWEQLIDQLAARLPRLQEDDVISLVGGPYRTELIQLRWGLSLQAVSNRFLPPELHLSTEQERQLREKGWQPPNPPFQLNWWLDVDKWPLHSRDAAWVAELMISTLRDVHDVTEPGDVEERSFNATR
jgi:hypothetical protein